MGYRFRYVSGVLPINRDSRGVPTEDFNMLVSSTWFHSPIYTCPYRRGPSVRVRRGILKGELHCKNKLYSYETSYFNYLNPEILQCS